MKLRDYQHRDIRRIKEAFARRRSVLYQLPTGGGKTVVLSRVTDLSHGRVLVLCHRRELVAQSVAKLRAVGITPGVVAGADPNPNPDARVQVAMVQTLARRQTAGKPLPPAELVIVDETHLAAAATWSRLLLSGYPRAWRLGVTATPERLDGKPLSDLYGELVCGPTVAELTAAGHLVNADVYSIPGADLSGVRRAAGEYRKADAAAAMDRPALVGDAVAHYRRLADGKRGIVYAASLDHAHRLAAAFGGGWRAITGSMPAHQRDRLVAKFRAGEITGLTNYGVLVEGVDVPGVEYVGWMRPTASLVIWLQGCGRGLRPAPGKSRVVIADHAGNAIRHGLPADDRSWSLHGRPKRAKAAGPAMTTCRECLAIWSRDMTGRACPRCGAEPAAVVRRQPVVRDGLLVKVTKADLMRSARAQSMTVDERPPPRWAPPVLWRRLESKRKREGYALGWTVGACRRLMR